MGGEGRSGRGTLVGDWEGVSEGGGRKVVAGGGVRSGSGKERLVLTKGHSWLCLFCVCEASQGYEESGLYVRP